MSSTNIDFGRVWIASGAQGFFGEGYWFHPYLKPIGEDFDGATFTAKTGTLLENKGSMALKADFTPRDLFPDCIIVRPLQGIMLNAVGLSNPGFAPLLKTRRWQNRRDKFFLSFMAIGKSPEERLQELRDFVTLLKKYLPEFWGMVGLQINYSCPNTGHKLTELLQEIYDGLEIAAELGIPIYVKLNALTPVEVARDISLHKDCTGLIVSNAIPFGQLPDLIPWKKLFGDVSPLAKYGGGGLSGKFLLPILLDWLKRARRCGITKHINAGGGILSVRDALEVWNTDADSISLGSIATLRPWWIKKIIAAVNNA